MQMSHTKMGLECGTVRCGVMYNGYGCDMFGHTESTNSGNLGYKCIMDMVKVKFLCVHLN